MHQRYRPLKIRPIDNLDQVNLSIEVYAEHMKQTQSKLLYFMPLDCCQQNLCITKAELGSAASSSIALLVRGVYLTCRIYIIRMKNSDALCHWAVCREVGDWCRKES